MEEKTGYVPNPEDKKAQKLRTAAYCRVSTKSDLQDGSFEMQKEYYKNYIEHRKDMVLVDIYGDYGKSGKSMRKRTELNRLLDDCKAGRIDLILCKSISRFARNLPECIAAVRELRQYGTGIYFEREDLDTRDEKQELLLSILSTIAQEESNSISQNIRWSRKKHYELGQPVEKSSYAYRKTGADRRWHIHEPEARRVRLAFYLAGCGTRYPQILAQLNALEQKEQTGKIWNQTPLVNLLKNVAYIGDYLSNKECEIVTEKGIKRCKNRGHADQYYIIEHHEPLISRELFEGVGQLLERHLLFSNRTIYTEADRILLQHCRELAEKELKSYV